MLPPECDQIGCILTPARQSCFGVPLHIVKVSYRAPPLRVGPHLVNPASTVRALGIYIDANLSRRTQVLKTTATCFAALQQLRTVHLCLPLAAYKSLIVSLIVSMMLSRMDYGNATLSGLPDYQFHRLQSFINAAARSIFNLRWSDHVTSALMELH